MDKNFAPQPSFNEQPHLHASPMAGAAGLPVIIAAPVFGPQSSSVYCRTCSQTVKTTVIIKSGGKTHLIAVLLCAIGCCLCAPCVYCVDSFRVMDHYCPNCNSYLGAYSSI